MELCELIKQETLFILVCHQDANLNKLKADTATLKNSGGFSWRREPSPETCSDASRFKISIFLACHFPSVSSGPCPSQVPGRLGLALLPLRPSASAPTRPCKREWRRARRHTIVRGLHRRGRPCPAQRTDAWGGGGQEWLLTEEAPREGSSRLPGFLSLKVTQGGPKPAP